MLAGRIAVKTWRVLSSPRQRRPLLGKGLLRGRTQVGTLFPGLGFLFWKLSILSSVSPPVEHPVPIWSHIALTKSEKGE